MSDQASTPSPAQPPAAGLMLGRLPVQVRMLMRVMGEAATFKLLAWRGGVPFTVPKAESGVQFAQLVDVVGDAAARALVAECSGITLQLPRHDAVRRLRHQRVVELRLGKTKLADIALETGYTQRQVIKILNLARLTAGVAEEAVGDPADEQLDLFGHGDLVDGVSGSEGAAGSPPAGSPGPEKAPTAV